MLQLDLTGHCKIIIQINNISHNLINIDKGKDTYIWLELPNRFKWDEKQKNDLLKH